MKSKVYETLDRMNIKYDIVNHPPAWTTEEADEYIMGKDGVPSKTMFMTGKKKKRFYLIIMDDSKMLDIKKINEIVGDKLSFGKEELLREKMNVAPGIVSIFGLLNNSEKDIEVIVDADLKNEEIITFHPNDNRATIFIKMVDMYKFLDEMENSWTFADI